VRDLSTDGAKLLEQFLGHLVHPLEGVSFTLATSGCFGEPFG